MKYKKSYGLLIFPLLFSAFQNEEVISHPNFSDYSFALQGETAQVIVLAGQSNMEGCSWVDHLPHHYDAELINIWTEGYASSLIMFNNVAGNYTSEQCFVKTKLGQGTSPHHFGPEVGIAEKIAAVSYIDPVFIIKFACGGSNLYNQWSSPSSGVTGPLYTAFIDFINLALNKLLNHGITPKIHGLCWMQGESDALNDTPNPLVYYQKLKDFVSDFRLKFNEYAPTFGIGFIDAYISDSPYWPRYQNINAAKLQFAKEDELNVVLDTLHPHLSYHQEPQGNIDLAHYDADAMITLGHLFGEALLNQFLN